MNAKKKLAEFFAQNDFIEARKLILIAEQANIYWAKNLTSYLDLQFSHEIENNYTKKYENTNTVINGTTSYLQVNTTSFFAVVIIKNPTPHKLKIRLNYSELNIDQNSTLAERIYSSGVIDYFTPVLEEQPDIKFRPRFEIKLPEKIIIPESRISYGKDSFCFVLTACYGDENHPVVVDFRNFRDIYLNKFYLGRKLTVMYYHFGPKAARFISNKSYIKNNLIIIFDAIRKILPKTTSK